MTNTPTPNAITSANPTPGPSFQSLTIADFLGQLGAKTPTPGGGAVAGIVSAIAAALAHMVLNYSVGKKNLADSQPAIAEALIKVDRARTVVIQLADEDAAAYGLVNELSRLPEGDPRRMHLEAAQAASTQVPLAIAATCLDLLRLFAQLPSQTNRALRSDLAIAAILAEAGVRSAACNVQANRTEPPTPQWSQCASQSAHYIQLATDISAKVQQDCS